LFLFFCISPLASPTIRWKQLETFDSYYSAQCTLYVIAAAKRCVNRYEPDASTKTRKDKRNEIIIVVSPAVTSADRDNRYNAVCTARTHTTYSEAFYATGLVETHTHTHHINIIISSVARTHTNYKQVYIYIYIV